MIRNDCKKCVHYELCRDFVCSEQDMERDTDCDYYEEERPHGEWKQVGEMTYRCTECGWLTKTCLIPYCQNCGSDNRKKGDKDV